MALANRRAELLSAAGEILRERGPEALTMRNVAAAVGIRAPSVYRHFADKNALEEALIAAGAAELGGRLSSWSQERGTGLARIARGYRRFALENRHLYRLMTEREPAGRSPSAGLELDGVAPLVALLGNSDRARAALAFAHGMVHLELSGRFPPGTDLDAAWEAGVRALSA